jgi:NAD(P)-dependent dehydrogenase (short-subunit alcohol dehydrogenase family)
MTGGNITERPKALILGASRGLGLGLVAEYLARGWQVIATIRSEGIPDGLKQLKSAHADQLQLEQADINQPESVEALKGRIGPGELDLIFVNAGVSRGAEDNASTMPADDFIDLMITNALSPIRAITTLHDRLKRGAAVAVMSSNLASIANNSTGTWEVYRASKASLNTLLRSFAVRNTGDGLTYLCISPGWVRTDMGGEEAPLDVETSVKGISDTVDARKGSGGVHYIDYLNAPIQW